MKNTDPIGVFDSGIGGISVLEKCEQLLPSEKFIYLADTANMPYGNKSAEDIRRLACRCADRLFKMDCKALVIACNTATATAADRIRARYPNRIVVGLEPAVKPCYRELGRTGYGVALVTEATYRSQRFRALLDACEGRIAGKPTPELARLIEDNADDISRIAPYVFGVLEEYKTAEAVVLGCSHYTRISDIIKRFYAGNIKLYDGATGAAQRLKYCLALSDMLAPPSASPPPVIFIE